MSEHDLGSLNERLEFLGIDQAARTGLKALQPTIRDSIGGALDAFYVKARGNPHTKRFFQGDQHIASAKARQEGHWDLIATGEFGARYIEGVSKVGKMHAKLGLEPRWYIGGYALILEKLIAGIMQKHWPSRFGRKKADPLAAQIGLVVKAALLDMDYAVSVYLEALEDERRKAEAAKAAADTEREEAMAAFGEAFKRLRQGDLSARMPLTLPGSFQTMAGDYNASVGELETAIGSVVESVQTIRTGLGEISVASNDLAQRTEQQAATLEETVAALAEVTGAVDETAKRSAIVQSAAVKCRTNAQSGGEVVGRAVAAMTEIEQSSDQIGKIIGVIDEIAFQTNLLALNAGVEAARAGEAGRGFAVVAQEVRGLAQRSAEAAKEIKNLISTSRHQVERGVALVSQSGRSLGEIVGEVTDMSDAVDQIAKSAREQAVSLKEVSAAADQMDKVTQQNAAMVEETTAAAQTLSTETEELATLMERFRIGSGARKESARTPPRRVSPGPRPVETTRAASRPLRSGGGGATAAARPRAEASADEWQDF